MTKYRLINLKFVGDEEVTRRMTQEDCRERLRLLMEKHPQIDHEKHLEDLKACREYMEGNTAAFERMFEGAQKKLCAFVHQQPCKLLNYQDKEDIISEVTAEAVTRMYMFNGWSLFSTWMKAIARYRVITCINKKKRVLIIDDEVFSKLADRQHKTSLCPQNDYSGNEILNLLPKNDAYIIKCRVLNEMDFNDIAKTLNKSGNSIKKRYYKLIEILKNNLENIAEQA